MTFRTFAYVMTCSSLVLFAAGCRSSRAGQTEPSRRAAAAPRQALDVLIEEGKPSDMQPRQYTFRCELRDYMERDLPRRLARYGFDARMIRQRGEHTDAARHLLVVHYDSYNPGSSAARIVVGYGAGAASLDMSMSLYQGETVALAWKDGCGTSGHWTRIINKLDDNLGKKLQAFYQKR